MKNRRIKDLLLIIIPVVFYIIFSIVDGPIICDDSPGYLNMSSAREPLYPLFIALIKLISEKYYLNIVVFIQGLLLAYTTYSLVKYIKEEYHLRSIFAYIILFIFLSISLMCRFVAKRGSMYSNCILSEGLAYPLFLLFFRYLLERLIHSDTKPIKILIILSVLLISIRKQMYISLILLLIVEVYKAIINKFDFKKVFQIVLIFIITTVSVKVIDYGYMGIFHNSFTTHTSDNRFLTTMIFYVSDREDAELIKDQKTKEIFLKIYDECEKNGYLKNEDYIWLNRVEHFENNYDNIQVQTMEPILEKEVSSLPKVEANIIIDQYNDTITRSLITKVWPDILSTFDDNVLAGLVITIAQLKEIFVFYSIGIYFIYFYLLSRCLKKNGLDKYSLFGIISIISIFVNVCLISATIFNQTRYTIYNMGLFYTSLLLMFYNIFIKKSK